MMNGLRQKAQLLGEQMDLCLRDMENILINMESFQNAMKQEQSLDLIDSQNEKIAMLQQEHDEINNRHRSDLEGINNCLTICKEETLQEKRDGIEMYRELFWLRREHKQQDENQAHNQVSDSSQNKI